MPVKLTTATDPLQILVVPEMLADALVPTVTVALSPVIGFVQPPADVTDVIAYMDVIVGDTLNMYDPDAFNTNVVGDPPLIV